MVTKIRIKKLFNYFDYEIIFKKDGITILTGPNGYGKTTILRMLHALANCDLRFFNKLVFGEFEIFFKEKKYIKFSKQDDGLLLKKENSEPLFLLTKDFEVGLKEFLRRSNRKIGEEIWENIRTDKIFTTSDLIGKYSAERYGLSLDIVEDFETYFIREQRLLKRDAHSKNHAWHHFPEGNERFQETIEEFAEDLKKLITDTLAESSEISQKLDSSFPRRLFDEMNEISEQDFNQRFAKVSKIQKSLSKYDLSVINEEYHSTTYKPENAKALLVYLNDTEQKLEGFEHLLKRLELFAGILNERRFTNKKIKIQRETGFEFIASDGSKLPLADLSSGEKQEIVLLYELLFKVKEGTLVLIDEPEISLHVAWQKEFLKDLLKVVEIQKFNVLIATHSPQIINERWDLTVDLEECSKCENTLMKKIS